MKDKIRFGNSTITYSIVKSKRRKTSQIIVDAKGVVVQTPLSKKDSEIKKMVEAKSEWIFKKRLEFRDKRKKDIKTKTKTGEYLEKRTWKIAKEIGLVPSKVIIKKLKSRWGSADKKGVVSINSVLTKTPPRIIDYVIIHELCHLKVNNHSNRFWDLVYSFDKKYQQKINWLEKNSVVLLRN